jgi:hypothetical protein
VLVWTAPDGIDCARMSSLLISYKGGRPRNSAGGKRRSVARNDSSIRPESVKRSYPESNVARQILVFRVLNLMMADAAD